MATKIGEAFFEIRANGDGALSDASKIGQQIGDTKAEIQLTADTGGLDKIKGQIRDLGKNEVRISVDHSELTADIQRLKSELTGMTGKEWNFEVKTRSLAAAQAEFRKLNDLARDLSGRVIDVRVDATGVTQIIADTKTLKSIVNDLTGMKASITIDRGTQDVARIKDQLSEVRDIAGSLTAPTPRSGSPPTTRPSRRCWRRRTCSPGSTARQPASCSRPAPTH